MVLVLVLLMVLVLVLVLLLVLVPTPIKLLRFRWCLRGWPTLARAIARAHPRRTPI